MNKDDFKKLADNSKYIPGIYNYCDRWCERCPFTARCLNYVLSETQFNDPESRDFNNQKFWDKLDEVFKITLELITDEAEELGINLSDLDIEQDEKVYEVKERIIESNKNLAQADKYINLVNEWFNITENDFKDMQEQLLLEDRLDIKGSSPFEKALTITDAVEIIRWYQFQIFVKIKRALFSRIEGENTDDSPKDSDGSAKVALIGIDRSIGAWGKLYNYFTERQNDILDILIHLSRLRESLELEFPDARKFKRIGFDD